MALTTWRTLLLRVKFEIFSDQNSLQYLFMQKSPSQRILRLCEFLVDYNFEEVKYVPGPQNVIPDFLSQPREATGNEPASLHMLVKRWPTQKSCRPTKTQPVQPCVIVMHTWQNQLAMRDKDGASGLWSLTHTNTETSAEADRGQILQGPLHLGVIQQSTGASDMIAEIQKAVATDSYLSGVLHSVMDLDNNLFRHFFLDVRKTLCYQRVEDARPRVCVPAVCREAVLCAAHGDSTLAGHPGVDHSRCVTRVLLARFTRRRRSFCTHV